MFVVTPTTHLLGWGLSNKVTVPKPGYNQPGHVRLIPSRLKMADSIDKEIIMSSVETVQETTGDQPSLEAAPRKKAAKKAAPKKAAKKTAKKKAAKKGGKKAVKKTGTKAKKTPRAKKEGLRKPQVRVLAALEKASRALNRAEISAKGEVDLAMLNSYIGSHDDKVRAKNDKNVCLSLLTLGYVKTSAAEEEGHGVYYKITATGSTALKKAKEAEKAAK